MAFNYFIPRVSSASLRSLYGPIFPVSYVENLSRGRQFTTDAGLDLFRAIESHQYNRPDPDITNRVPVRCTTKYYGRALYGAIFHVPYVENLGRGRQFTTDAGPDVVRCGEYFRNRDVQGFRPGGIQEPFIMDSGCVNEETVIYLTKDYKDEEIDIDVKVNKNKDRIVESLSMDVNSTYYDEYMNEKKVQLEVVAYADNLDDIIVKRVYMSDGSEEPRGHLDSDSDSDWCEEPQLDCFEEFLESRGISPRKLSFLFDYVGNLKKKGKHRGSNALLVSQNDK